MKGVIEGMIEGIRRELRFVGRTLWRMTRNGCATLAYLALFVLAAMVVVWFLKGMKSFPP